MSGLRKSNMQRIDNCKSNFYVFSRLQICQINKSSVMRQKGKSQSECYKKAKHRKFSEKRILRIRGKKCSFFGKFDVFHLIQ